MSGEENTPAGMDSIVDAPAPALLASCGPEPLELPVYIRRAVIADPHPEAAVDLGNKVAALGYDTGLLATADLMFLLKDGEPLPDVLLMRLNRTTAGMAAEFLRQLQPLRDEGKAESYILAVTDVDEPVSRVEAWLARGVNDFLTDPRRLADGGSLGTRLAVAENALRQRENASRQAAAEASRGQDFEQAFHASGFGLLVLEGAEGRILDLNSAACRLLGFAPDDLRQQPLALLLPHLPENTNPEAREPHQAGSGPFQEIRHLRPDGSTVCLEAALTPLPGWGQAAGPVRLMTLHDLTDGKIRGDRRLREARLETACRVMSGTARALGDSLTAVRGNLELLHRQPVPPAEMRELAHQAREACDRAVGLSKRLTALPRLTQGGSLRRLAVDLRILLEKVVPFTLLNRRAKPLISLADDLWPVEADESALAEMLRCLTANADEAMPAGGTLHLQAENAVSPETAAPAVRLTVRDEGHGIRPEDLPALFDPWFTTRPGREGMGLATVAGIVKAHGGQIHAESGPGNGTSFTLWLPAIPPSPASAGAAANFRRPADGTASPPVVPAPAKPVRPKARILLMDDDSGVRLVMERILAHAGYEVYGTRDGQEAVDACRKAVEFGTPFDLLLVDLDVRDGMGGLECVDCLKQEFPHLKALLTTGCLDHAIMDTWMEHGLLGVIPKPFQIDTLVRSLDQLTAPL